ncbi:MAG: hypothetical protein M0D55_14720 [Elusimicrobiota bacterium]|nr:MAG: hypothetical protein M0D55_14720 [Elusimicrobiota bacterium]
MKKFLFVALAMIAAASASAMNPATETFLKEIGLDPQSAEIQAVQADSVTTKTGVVKTLDSLAAKRDEDGLRRFVATRNFVQQFRQNPRTKFPPAELYDTSLLTPGEVSYILAELKKPWRASA